MPRSPIEEPTPMPNYPTASRTKEHFAKKLLSDYPEIVSIAPRLALDSNGQVTSDGVIVVGVRQVNPRHDLTGKLLFARQEIPSELPAVAPDGSISVSEVVKVIVEYTGEISFEMNTGRQRPCPGGFSISNSAHGRTAGTLGAAVRVEGEWGFILSNNHVLARNNNAQVGENIWQPGQLDGGQGGTPQLPTDTIAILDRWVAINFDGRTPNEVDCALARATDPWNDVVSRNVQGIGSPTDIGEAQEGQAIRKSGRTTQLTTGSILSDNATIRLDNNALFENQLEYSRMTEPGDSGSLIFDHNSLTVVGIHFAGSDSASYGNKISRVLQLLGRAFSVYSINGKETKFDKVNIELFDPHSD